MYIQAPNKLKPITIRKGKPFQIVPAKREEVPEMYRKKTLKQHAYENLLYVVGFKEFVRKEVLKWVPQKTKQLFKRGSTREGIKERLLHLMPSKKQSPIK